MITKKQKNLNKATEIVEIDVKGEILGRISTRIAAILMGKDNPKYVPNLVMGRKVHVINSSKIQFTGNKINSKEYIHHTGYLGHLKVKPLKKLMADNPADVIFRSVKGMLPKNRLQRIMLKNLTIEK